MARVLAVAMIIGALSPVVHAKADYCSDAIAARESVNMGLYTALNPSTGAYGKYQFLPLGSGGVYDETPWGRAGIPVNTLTADQQEAVYSWVVENEGYWPWGGCNAS